MFQCNDCGVTIKINVITYLFTEAMVLSQKRVACPLQIAGEILPQVEEFKYLGVLFMSEKQTENREQNEQCLLSIA